MLTARLRRVGCGLICAAVVAVAVFKVGRCRDGETLARSLKGPIRSLCLAYHPEESGGCYADCQKRLAVSDAQSTLRAARSFAAIPTHRPRRARLVVERRRDRLDEDLPKPVTSTA